jgi:hypothetical protein
MSLATRTILSTLSLERLRTLARDFDAEHLWPMTKAAAVDNLEKCPGVRLEPLLDMLLFDELAKVCKVLGLDERAHRREVLVVRLLEANRLPAPDPTPAAVPVTEPAATAQPTPILTSPPARRVHRAARPVAPPRPSA